MRHLTKGIAALAVASLALFAVGCNKGPAADALDAADQALAAATPEIERYVPEELGSLTSAAQAARSEFEKGNYTEALKAAQALPAKIQAALAAATAKKDQLVAAWNDMSGSLAGLVQAITGKVTGLAAAKALPKGMTKDDLVDRPDRSRVGDPGLDRGHGRVRGRRHPEGPRDRAGRQDQGRRARGNAGAPGCARARRREQLTFHGIIGASGPAPGSSP